MKMKSKRDKDLADKEEHRLNRFNAKRRKRGEEPVLERKKPSRGKKTILLIACEGENTEPSYFNQFKLRTIDVEAKGQGYSHVSLVDWALKVSKLKRYDEVWVVFDADPKPDDPKWKERFNNAIWKAQGIRFRVGYSHQAFEYWLLLHFEDHQGGAMHRSEYKEKINAHINPLGAHYDGDGEKRITPEFFELLQGVDSATGKRRQDLAICRAQKIYERYDHSNPAAEESSTTVFQLVLRLMEMENEETISTQTFCDRLKEGIVEK